MASLPGLGGVYSKSILGLNFPNSQWELDSPASDAHPGVVPPSCVESDPIAVPGDWDLFLQHHGGGKLGGQGVGSDKALVTQAASCPRLFFHCPARLLLHCPTPTPSSPKLLIPDSCNDCRQRWGEVCHQPAAIQATPTT